MVPMLGGGVEILFLGGGERGSEQQCTSEKRERWKAGGGEQLLTGSFQEWHVYICMYVYVRYVEVLSLSMMGMCELCIVSYQQG